MPSATCPQGPGSRRTSSRSPSHADRMSAPMMPTVKVAHRILLLPALAAVALGLAVATIASLGRSDLSTLTRIRTGHYPAVELMHSLQGELTAVGRGLQDAVAARDEDAVRAVDSLASDFRHTLESG